MTLQGICQKELKEIGYKTKSDNWLGEELFAISLWYDTKEELLYLVGRKFVEGNYSNKTKPLKSNIFLFLGLKFATNHATFAII